MTLLLASVIGLAGTLITGSHAMLENAATVSIKRTTEVYHGGSPFSAAFPEPLSWEEIEALCDKWTYQQKCCCKGSQLRGGDCLWPQVVPFLIQDIQRIFSQIKRG